MSKDLATINCDSPIKVNLKDTIMGDLNDNKDKIELFQKLEFKQLLNDIDSSASENNSETEHNFEVIHHFDNINFKKLDNAIIHFEIYGSNYLKDKILKFGLYAQNQYIVISAEDIHQYTELIEWLENDHNNKIVFDAKKTYVAAHRLEINLQHIDFDVMLASYIIDPSRTIEDVQSVVSYYNQNFVKSDIAVYGKGKNDKFH